ncbi:hypothetical protein ACHWQZ_G005118 [Mnemiopsis leidyi]
MDNMIGKFREYDTCMSQFLDEKSDPNPMEGFIFLKCKLHFCEVDGEMWRPRSFDMCLPPLDYVWGMIHVLLGLLGFKQLQQISLQIHVLLGLLGFKQPQQISQQIHVLLGLLLLGFKQLQQISLQIHVLLGLLGFKQLQQISLPIHVLLGLLGFKQLQRISLQIHVLLGLLGFKQLQQISLQIQVLLGLLGFKQLQQISLQIHVLLGLLGFKQLQQISLPIHVLLGLLGFKQLQRISLQIHVLLGLLGFKQPQQISQQIHVLLGLLGFKQLQQISLQIHVLLGLLGFKQPQQISLQIHVLLGLLGFKQLQQISLQIQVLLGLLGFKQLQQISLQIQVLLGLLGFKQLQEISLQIHVLLGLLGFKQPQQISLQIHVLLGLLGFALNAVSLSAFVRLVQLQAKPYYIVMIFKAVTDLILCLVAIYSGTFLVTERPTAYNSPVCELSGWLWNWNMVTTPLLIALAGLMKIRAVYWPHSNSLASSKPFITALCIGAFSYGAVFACYPYFFESVQYHFFNWWSICDFLYDEKDHRQSLMYSLIMGPVPMCCSLLVIIVTNIVIARYLFLRYKKSWEKAARGEKPTLDRTQSKQIVISLLLITLWYFVCYSIIIFHNFKNLLINVRNDSSANSLVTDLSDLGQTYFYATYNFCAYLNSFANPIIHLVCGNTFRAELLKMRDSVAFQLRSVITPTEHEHNRTVKHASVAASVEEK